MTNALLEKFPALAQYTAPTAVSRAADRDPEETGPSRAIASLYMRAHNDMMIKADVWIRKNCSAVGFLPVGLFDWIKGIDADAYSDHVDLQARIDTQIEQRAPIEQFQQTLTIWARLYCQIARRAHQAMILELNETLRTGTENGLG